MKKIGINDFTFYNYPTGITASPDGKHAAIAVVNANEKDNTYDSCLWIHDTESKKRESSPVGKRNALLSGWIMKRFFSPLTERRSMRKR